MGLLKFISVTGAVPHSACYLNYKDLKYADEWLGFGPGKHRTPIGMGKVFNDDESYRENHSITIQVNDERMYVAARKVVKSYTSDPYVLTVHDCVSFTADIARQCGLLVPAVNFSPYGLILILAVWNKYERLT